MIVYYDPRYRKLARSKNIAQVICLVSRFFINVSVMLDTARDVERFDRNPNCEGVNKLCRVS